MFIHEKYPNQVHLFNNHMRNMMDAEAAALLAALGVGLELQIDFIMIISYSATAINFAREIYEAGNVEDVYRKDGPILPAVHIAHALLSITKQYKGVIFQ